MEENITFDIVNFIEKNPLSRLSKEYESQLINKIKNSFTISQQQFFLTNFYNFLNYNDTTDFIIDLDNIWKWIGFSRKDPAKRLLDKFFVKDIDYKIMTHPTVEQNQHGGQNKEQILLTINCFKKFCLKADTKKADEIHDYYVKLERLLQETIMEETDELKKQLQIKNSEIIKIKKEFKNELKINRHEILLETYKDKRCLYIGEIEENKFIKIGSSKEINGRYIQLKNKYDHFYFLDIFECNNFREVEENILTDPIIKKNLYRKSIKNSISKEIVLLNDEFTFNHLITIVKKYINESFFLTPQQIIEKKKLDIEEKKLNIEEKKIEQNKLFINLIHNNIDNGNLNLVLNNLLQNISTNINNDNINNDNINDDNINDDNINDDNINDDNINDDNINDNNINDDNINDDNINDDNIIDNINFIKYKNPNAKKIQKIDPHNIKNIIKVYDSMTYLIRSPENKGFTKSSILNAIHTKKIYKNFRWVFVNHGDDENISHAKPTVEKKFHSTSVYTILKLNSTKTEIINSYETKEKLKSELLISHRTLNKIINNKLLYNNCYYVEEHNCPIDLINNYKNEIKKNISCHSVRIKQINLYNKNETIFNSLSEIYTKVGITPGSVRNAIKNNNVLAGCKWEYI